MLDLLKLIITGGMGAAIIKLFEVWVKWRLDRKAKREDLETEEELASRHKEEEAAEAEAERREQEYQELLDGLKATRKGMKVILFDRIKYLGQKYIMEGCIDIDDRRALNNMHDVYHNDLGGNGDFAILMDQVNHLPLKK